MLGRLERYLRSLRGLNTVPGTIAIALWVLSLLCLSIDHQYPEFATSQPFRLFYTDYDTAKSVLSTVSAAAITTLGLVYSIVLVVFTTAAGNIGPRLLQRFTSDKVNQFTAGLFGGTFLFSLTVLHQTDPEFVPAFSISVTFFLAGLSVLQLIYFVHAASISVTIDEEVAEIASRLEEDIGRLLDSEDRDNYDADVPQRNENSVAIESESAGYVTEVDVAALVGLAKEYDLFIFLNFGQGDFIVPGLRLAEPSREITDEERSRIGAKVRTAITTSESRSPNSDIEFSINLLIEIALRALSPGVNDTFTAVACIDRISSALVRPVRRGLRDHIRSDEDRIPRLYLPGLTLKNLLDTAFHPLRRAAAGNILMTKHIMNALGRLHQLGDEDARKIIRRHADLVVENAKTASLLPADLEFVLQQHKRSILQS